MFLIMVNDWQLVLYGVYMGLFVACHATGLYKHKLERTGPVEVAAVRRSAANIR